MSHQTMLSGFRGQRLCHSFKREDTSFRKVIELPVFRMTLTLRGPASLQTSCKKAKRTPPSEHTSYADFTENAPPFPISSPNIFPILGTIRKNVPHLTLELILLVQ
ncbi:hypothetical protein Taro_009885 [Colocasia esculenta]|uniref:Uncharacterized protein n=1 Tax=Colocasia esculenta TaxID=4460 RepID=A0A843TXI4_COLES|nr:hypothetical protein [Colocasia esculenta]